MAKDLKQTVFLPKTIPNAAGLPKKEPEIQPWDEIVFSISSKSVKVRKNLSFMMAHHTPIVPHIGHALNKILKISSTVSSLQLKDANYVPGWIAGLLIEWKIEEQYRKEAE